MTCSIPTPMPNIHLSVSMERSFLPLIERQFKLEITLHEFNETCHSVAFIVLVNFTPKMKANAEPRLLPSLV